MNSLSSFMNLSNDDLWQLRDNARTEVKCGSKLLVMISRRRCFVDVLWRRRWKPRMTCWQFRRVAFGDNVLLVFDRDLCCVAVLTHLREVAAGIYVVSDVTIRKLWVTAAHLRLCDRETLLKLFLLLTVGVLVAAVHG